MEKDCFMVLEEMTPLVPAFNPYYFSADRVMHLSAAGGDAYTCGVYKDVNVSIAKTTFDKDTVLPKHRHPQIEHVHVLTGELVVTIIENRKRRHVTIKQYESITLNPNVVHFCRAVEKTTIIAITMPFSPYFPNPDAKHSAVQT